MKIAKFILTLILASALLFACTKNDELQNKPDCNALNNALRDLNDVGVKEEINKVCVQLLPRPSASDTNGLQKQLDKLVNILNNNCGLDAVVVCYGCIKTLPVQSEIEISYQNNGQSRRKIIDIYSPENHDLSFAGMHD